MTKICNLNCIIKPTGIDYSFDLSNATAVSFMGNQDSDGFYCDQINKVYASEGKLNLMKWKKKMRDSNFIITHQRISTSGKNFENSQPFMGERFVLAHNGMISIKANLLDVRKSDTKIFFDEFVKQFAEKQNIKLAIEEAFKEVTGNWLGSYSIFIYDKQTNEGYYFKNDSTTIEISKLSTGAYYVTTKPDNLLFFSWDKQYKIDENILYKFTIKNNKPNLQSIGKLKVEKPYKYTPSGYSKNALKGKSTPHVSVSDHCRRSSDSKMGRRYGELDNWVGPSGDACDDEDEWYADYYVNQINQEAQEKAVKEMFEARKKEKGLTSKLKHSRNFLGY